MTRPGIEAGRNVTGLVTAQRLAPVTENALVNGDPRRARAALRDVHDVTLSGETLDALPAFSKGDLPRRGAGGTTIALFRRKR